MSRISQQQLESYLWGAATLLRGTIDAGDYKQFIFPLLFYKRLCDVFDEETQLALKESGGDTEFAAYPENHRFQVPQEAHWFEVRQTSLNVGRALQAAMRAIEKANPDKLYGIFGDAQWTNKERLPDVMLRDLIEHFSCLELTVANLPEDELGQGYEYLIKKFADDSGHTAAEFYTNRTVVHLMTEMLQPQPGESIYDPTCGSGGMLLSSVTHLRRQGKEWRNVRLYGQERNLMTSSIARMNCFLHGIEDFEIVRGDTLAEPKLVEGDRLKQFDVVLANPPYSIKQWNREAFASDPWGRNLYGVPPQGRADYAFWQHILQSLNPQTGRCAILFPHGVLFRQEEAEMRRKLIEADLVECVLGLGPNLFYNASMEACVVICRIAKPKGRKGRTLFINAVNEVSRERAQSFLTDVHIKHITEAYTSFKDQPGFTKAVTLEELRKNEHSLKVDLYVATPTASNGNSGIASEQTKSLDGAFNEWCESRVEVRDTLSRLLPDLKILGSESEALGSFQIGDVEKAFTKGKWTRVRFGDVVRLVKDAVDPESGELERYVAGEHMESENVHIRQWGTVGDGYLGPAFIRRFRKGQVLYGSRRTYLKKVAFAEFDGITANTTFVLEGVDGKLHQPLLPWIMLSQRFTEHSVRESKGSTNPYINFPDIAKFEFDLPPLDQQRRIAEILWSMYKQISAVALALKTTDELRDARFEHFLYVAGRWPQLETGELLAEPPRNGFSPPANESGCGLPTLSNSAIRGGKVIPEGSVKYAEVNPAAVERFKLREQDILVVRGNGNRLLCGLAGIVTNFPADCFFPDLLIRLRFREEAMVPEFAVMQWNEKKTHRRLLQKAKSTNGISKINGQDVRNHKLIVPPLEDQILFLESVARVMSLSLSLQRLAADAKNLQVALTNMFLGGKL